MNRTHPTQILVFVTCAFLVIAYFAPFGGFLDAQPAGNWVASPMHISMAADPLAFSGYNVSQIRAAYSLPSSGGAGTTIAIVNAYDVPSILSDLTIFSAQFNLPIPNSTNFEVVKMNQSIVPNSNWTTETCLDVEWAHAIAPDAKILLVEAVNNTDDSLLSAVDYARSRSDVVAVSMSWGGPEYIGETLDDSHFTSVYGAVFFASSGDDGAGVIWPASSANVISVGGTTLNNPTGAVSETAWSGSGGGVSSYEPKPSYQTSYGLTAAKRSVPDVSYNADPSTGVRVYCNYQWTYVGGTSAGAPQWAAIQALGRSATNTNLYQKAKTSYSSYFRDITSGSNGLYTAKVGYDTVTGLGSPLTFNFNTSFDVSPISGPSNGSVTLNGQGFLGSSVNITYLNPINSSWIPIVNNWATSSGSFTYNLNAPDLLQNNTAGDNTAAFNNIVFRAQDNSNLRYYNSTLPYTEMRRGLSQVGNATASGLYGNSTNLAASVFVQNGDSMSVSGKWFVPGTASLFWDDTINLGTGTIDGVGSFSATVRVPTSTAGQHRLTVNDGNSTFCVNVTRLPTVTNNYTDIWRTTDFSINLTPDYPVNGTYYRINGEPPLNTTTNDLPIITTEGSANTLEYWSTWNVYGADITDLPHVTVTGIKLDKTPPTGSISPSSSTVTSPSVTLILGATDSASGVAGMRFANENSGWSTWEPYATSKIWGLTSGDGVKTVTVQYNDTAGWVSSNFSCTVTLQSVLATTNPTVPPTNTPTNKPANVVVTPSPVPSAVPTTPPTTQPTPTATPQAPELNIQVALILLAASTLLATLLFNKKRK